MKKIMASLDKQTKNFDRYIIDKGQKIVGTLYLSKMEDPPSKIKISISSKEGV